MIHEEILKGACRKHGNLRWGELLPREHDDGSPGDLRLLLGSAVEGDLAIVECVDKGV
jgi:hypothetical protein